MSWAVWITGLPGSGTSTLARAAAAELRVLGEPVRVLALDEIRETVIPSPAASDPGPDVLYRVLVSLAALLARAGVPVILDAPASRQALRNLARGAIARFGEVELLCPPHVRGEREPARPGGHARGGVHAFADEPEATAPGGAGRNGTSLLPEVLIDTAEIGIPEAAARVVALARLLAEPRPAVKGEARAGWAIWITGRPGSGKTTVAERVALTLEARGIRARVLDLGTVREFLSPAVCAAESLEEIAHRTLVHATRLLTEAGVDVIVDATAPRRVWREAARELIPCFAEVQLVCPAEICAERERASRWGLGAAPWEQRTGAPAGPGAPPDIAADYEESLRPDLVLHTNVHDLWSTVEQVLFLIHRLRRLTPIINLEQA